MNAKTSSSTFFIAIPGRGKVIVTIDITKLRVYSWQTNTMDKIWDENSHTSWRKVTCVRNGYRSHLMWEKL